MEYIGIGIVAVVLSFFVVHKINVISQHKGAINALVKNYGLSPTKLEKLSDLQLTGLTGNLNTLALSGQKEALTEVAREFKDQ